MFDGEVVLVFRFESVPFSQWDNFSIWDRFVGPKRWRSVVFRFESKISAERCPFNLLLNQGNLTFTLIGSLRYHVRQLTRKNYMNKLHESTIAFVPSWSDVIRHQTPNAGANLEERGSNRNFDPDFHRKNGSQLELFGESYLCFF